MFDPYERSAEVYDVLYEQMLDYDAAAEQVAGIILERSPGATTLLEVACGTGAYLTRLARQFEVAGLDRSPHMLAAAGRKLPGVELFEADMTDFALGRGFDAVICLFSSIAYAQTLPHLRATIDCFARHLNPGGVAIVEPWFSPDQWNEGYVGVLSARTDEMAVARASTSTRTDPRRVTLHFVFAVAYPDGSTDTYTEDHPTGQFTVDEHVAAFRDAGLEVEHDPEGLIGRGLYVAVKRP